MSKTYRRKNDNWDFHSYDYTWENGFMQKTSYDVQSKEFKKKKAHFHSDCYNGWCVPHWYVNMFHERSYRQHTKKELQKWYNNPESYEVVINRHMKDAGWNYW